MEKRDFHFQHHDCVLHLNYVYELYLTDKKRSEYQINMELINWREHIINYTSAWYLKKKIVPITFFLMTDKLSYKNVVPV